MAKLVARRYATALFEVALEENKLDLFFDELKNIVLIFNENEEFFKILKTPLISKNEKKGLVENIYKDKISNEILNFFKILVDKDRVSVIEDIFQEYKNLINEKNNIVEAVAVSAVPMSEDQINSLRDKLSQAMDKNVKVTNEVDKSILGGVLIRMGNEEIDGSIKTRLESLKKELSQIIA